MLALSYLTLHCNIFQASGYQHVVVTVGGEKNEEEDIGDGGEMVALRIHENTSSFMDEFFKQVNG